SSDPNSDATYGKTSTWGANFKVVYHLPDGTTLSANDSTTNSNNGTIIGATATSGQVDGAGNFNGSSYIDTNITSNTIFSNSTFTVSAWVKLNANSMLVAKGGFSQGFYAAADGVQIKGSSSTIRSSDGTINMADGAWHYYSAIITTDTSVAGNNNAHIYQDGSLHDGSLSTQFANVTSALSANIGRRNEVGHEIYANGIIDEVRISNAARSADWIKTEYNNQNSPSTFYSLGSELPPSGGNTFTVGAGTLTVGGNLTITGGSLDLTTNDPTTVVTGNVVINDTLLASNSANFTFGGDWTNNGTFTHNSGTVIVVPSAGVSSISIGGTSNTNFYNFTATDSALGNKQLNFQNGLTYGFYHNLTLSGSAGNGFLLLGSTTPGSQWTIYVDPSATTSLSTMLVQDSACAVGTLSLSPGATVFNGGNNGTCWFFVSRGRPDISGNIGGGSGGGTPVSGGGSGGSGGGGTSGGGGGVLPQAFTAADGSSLTSYDSNWTILGGGININTNAAYGTAVNTSMAQWTAGTFNDNQYSQITIAALTASNWIGTAVRTQGSGLNAYIANITSGGNYEIDKIVNGSGTLLASGNTAVQAGDILRLEISGTTLTIKLNGTTLTQTSDSTFSTGRPGIEFYGNSTSNRGDDWYADSLASQGGGGGGGGGSP
ncbi:MAG TPA: LamG-like jellyroll fold domain-containing protein, partial [Methylomirabilota bacterium]|nr:LamG-like jellyroll fold domain-containing protein [Methylomirabilota bacterium]